MGYVTTTAATPPSTGHAIFISGLDKIVSVGGGCLEFFFVKAREDGGQTTIERIPQSIIMPIDALPDAIGKALMALGRQVLVKADGSVTVMH